MSPTPEATKESEPDRSRGPVGLGRLSAVVGALRVPRGRAGKADGATGTAGTAGTAEAAEVPKSEATAGPARSGEPEVAEEVGSAGSAESAEGPVVKPAKGRRASRKGKAGRGGGRGSAPKAGDSSKRGGPRKPDGPGKPSKAGEAGKSQKPAGATAPVSADESPRTDGDEPGPLVARQRGTAEGEGSAGRGAALSNGGEPQGSSGADEGEPQRGRWARLRAVLAVLSATVLGFCRRTGAACRQACRAAARPFGPARRGVGKAEGLARGAGGGVRAWVARTIAALVGRARGGARRLPGWWPLAGGVLAGLVCGLLYTLAVAPQYTARGHVVVQMAGGGDQSAAVGLAQLYGRLADDPVVLSEAGPLPGAVRASTSPDAPVIEITGTAAEPSEAAAVANAVAPALVAYGNAAESPAGAELAVLSEALPPSTPSSPVPSVSLGVGAATGGVVGLLVLLARDYRREAVPEAAASGSGPSVPAS